MNAQSLDSRRPRVSRLLLVAIALGGLIVSASVALRALRAGSARILPVISAVPAFGFQDQSGSTVTNADLAGRVWIASFLYTTCPGPCPRLVERLAHVRRDFQGDPRVLLVSFSVDPEADTPEALGAYARMRGIDAAGWKLLTGPPESIYPFIRSGFLLAVERTERASEGDPDQGPVTHSTRLALVDGAGRIRGYYDSEDARALEELRADVRALLREP
jgi:protein SCO1/2